MNFRFRIREVTKDAHLQLEGHHLMRSYSNGLEYEIALNLMYSFWSAATPKTQKLPSKFHSFLTDYRFALLTDCRKLNLNLPPTSKQNIYEEEALFYTLIGSSHGARVIRSRLKNKELPKEHLNILSEDGALLWPQMISTLNNVDPFRESEILNSGLKVFKDLYGTLENST
ncbi:MAG: hypothetical protein CME64_08270 [Halobacteriovoraceae bacterium]|nr:hypothetical protein [Halobacteriovoraceae bacterium]|tara:strand:- start:200132 stop:200644 length:513 start_codon:yes stop_codon:yes gene_type:complete